MLIETAIGHMMKELKSVVNKTYEDIHQSDESDYLHEYNIF
jgi:hypothetical protein